MKSPRVGHPAQYSCVKQMASWTCEMSLHHCHTLYKSLILIGDLCFYSSENTLLTLSREMHQQLFKGSFNGSAWNKTVTPRRMCNNHQKHNWKQEIPFFMGQVDGELLCWGRSPDPLLYGWYQWNFQRELAKSYQLYLRYILLGPSIPISGIYPKKGLQHLPKKPACVPRLVTTSLSTNRVPVGQVMANGDLQDGL